MIVFHQEVASVSLYVWFNWRKLIINDNHNNNNNYRCNNNLHVVCIVVVKYSFLHVLIPRSSSFLLFLKFVSSKTSPGFLKVFLWLLFHSFSILSLNLTISEPFFLVINPKTPVYTFVTLSLSHGWKSPSFSFLGLSHLALWTYESEHKKLSFWSTTLPKAFAFLPWNQNTVIQHNK